jgi:hypothetical protein
LAREPVWCVLLYALSQIRTLIFGQEAVISTVYELWERDSDLRSSDCEAKRFISNCFANPQGLAIRNYLSCAKESQSVCVISRCDIEGRVFPSVPLPTTRPTVSGCTELGELMAGHY